MRPDPRLLAILTLILLNSSAQAGEGARPRAARLPCPQDAPEGVRLPDRPGCSTLPTARPPDGDGFRDVGGVRLRVGGRVGAEYGSAR
ncbi:MULTISPECIES: hypothetical protein [unclassified Methylobacterium]|jgi:hypothetical protein|uniref:hypothetical protein n=1 Tax=unclassified Methylobacterium TaxID=2615210 RepID=UPI0009EBAC1F|nr:MULTISPECIES: hypothetical protein [unclassified Methylobacterium]